MKFAGYGWVNIHVWSIIIAQQLLRSVTVCHNRYGPKSGGCCAPFRGGSYMSPYTMSPGPRFTSVPSSILIHLTVWAGIFIGAPCSLHLGLMSVNATADVKSLSSTGHRVVFSERSLTPVRLSSVCRLQRSCALLRRFKFTALGTLATQWHSLKIARRSSQGNPSAGELNTRGVAKHSDFGPIDGYSSETVQDRR